MVKCPWPIATPERGSLMLACLHALLSVQLGASKPLPCNQAFRAWWWWSSWHRVLQDLTNFKIKTIFLNWNIVDLKCCVTFRYITQWVSYTYVYIHTPPRFGVFFPFKSPQSIKQSSLYYTVNFHLLSILYKVLIVYICQSQSPSLSYPLPQFVSIHLFSMSICFIYFCFENKIIYTIFLREGNGTPLQYSCLENPMDGGAWKAAVHGVARSQTRMSDFTFTFHFHALEKEMATHSSALAWRIPGTGEPGGLLSIGLHRVGHDWET